MDKKRKRGKEYIPYDYEEAYEHQLELLDEFFVQEMLKNKVKCIYATKEIRSGDQFEVEIYPEFKVLPQLLQSKVIKKSNREAIKNLNDKNARKYLERKINANFGDDDIWVTFTYRDGCCPGDMKEALKNMQNYIKRLNYKRKKLGLSNARYIYVTEWEQDEKKEEIRCHHHVIMDGELDMDTCESIWKLGDRNNSRKLNQDEYGLTGMAHYVSKEPKGQKRWCCSIGLKEPVIKKNHYKFKPRQVEQMVKDRESIREMMEKRYKNKGYLYTSSEVRYNGFNNLFYIYVRMRKEALRNTSRPKPEPRNH